MRTRRDFLTHDLPGGLVAVAFAGLVPSIACRDDGPIQKWHTEWDQALNRYNVGKRLVIHGPVNYLLGPESDVAEYRINLNDWSGLPVAYKARDFQQQDSPAADVRPTVERYAARRDLTFLLRFAEHGEVMSVETGVESVQDALNLLHQAYFTRVLPSRVQETREKLQMLYRVLWRNKREPFTEARLEEEWARLWTGEQATPLLARVEGAIGENGGGYLFRMDRLRIHHVGEMGFRHQASPITPLSDGRP